MRFVLRILILPLVFFPTSLFAQEGESATGLLSLIEAMQKAVDHSYDLKSSNAQLYSAEYERAGSLREMAPLFSAQGDYAWQEKDVKTGLNGVNSTTQATLSLSQPILGLIKSFHNYQQKDIQVQIQQELANSTRSQAALAGATFYLNMLLSMEELSIAQANAETIKKSREDAQVLYETGSIYRDDFLRIDLQYSQGLQQISTTKSKLEIARFSLAQALGLSPASFHVDDKALSYWEVKKPLIPDLSEAQDMALRSNFELLAAAKNVDFAQKNQTLAWDAYLPNIDFFMDYKYDFGNDVSDTLYTSQNTMDYGFRLTWDLWDWGVRQAQIDAQVQNTYQKKYEESAQKEKILTQVVTRYYEIQNNVESLKISKDALKIAQEAYDLVSLRFSTGQVSALDLTTAQQNLTTAKSNLAQSRFNLDLSWITFYTLLGKNQITDL